MNTNLAHILDQLKNLTLLEAHNLVKEIEKEFEVNIAQTFSTPSPVVAVPTIDTVVEEEQSSFDLYLIEVPLDKKIAALKIVRSATGFGLKESKEIVDTVPKMIKEGMSKEEAEVLKNEFEAVGAKIQIK